MESWGIKLIKTGRRERGRVPYTIVGSIVVDRRGRTETESPIAIGRQAQAVCAMPLGCVVMRWKKVGQDETVPAITQKLGVLGVLLHFGRSGGCDDAKVNEVLA